MRLVQGQDREAKMAEVTREMILEYMQAKNGVVKNVDLVRHFRKHLQQSDSRARGLCTQHTHSLFLVYFSRATTFRVV